MEWTLRLINYDSRGDKAESANIIQRFINKDKVCGVIGEPTSGGTLLLDNRERLSCLSSLLVLLLMEWLKEKLMYLETPFLMPMVHQKHLGF